MRTDNPQAHRLRLARLATYRREADALVARYDRAGRVGGATYALILCLVFGALAWGLLVGTAQSGKSSGEGSREERPGVGSNHERSLPL